MPYTHIAFSDESCWNEHQYRTLSLVTIDRKYFTEINNRFKDILKSSDVREFKWKKFESARYRFCAEKIFKAVFEICLMQQMRIDVISWDTYDSRHSIQGRCDLSNLGRMYYHLLGNCFKSKWPDQAIWKIIPDEHTGIDWSSVHDTIHHKSTSYEAPELNLFNSHIDNLPAVVFKSHFNVHELEQGKSEEHPLLQIADLFAGMVAFSRNNYEKYSSWLSDQMGSLFPNEDKSSYSKRDIDRFHALTLFNKLSKSNKLQISLQSQKGLRSFSPKKPINFWWYIPQHENDKAPTKFSE